ncbi:MAG TPA: chromosomal replication initiator protein DnaA [Candidatus Sumerlaeota bacterium]|nr:MAG: Chromosomal replication initiator protein DnaA [candidate division BRC1 bacterium ADurb.BinA292]HOE97531.1 chromosomal replication initiator protein DnaA [Candidatus Sumerlaeota bacterium]HOR27906.1 chromosomal replication initiator protein DnaA [Candidatus Sumerlaeota bacterium]HPK00979.1 chromosomal replication initiator protein DnaA [Candidatus Sumerlaeota bacterium]
MTRTASALWDQALDELRERLDRESFTTWIEPVQLLRQEGHVVQIGVPTLFYRNWLANNFHEPIQDCLSRLLRADVQLEYEIMNEVDEEEAPLAPGGLSQTEQRAMEVFRRGRRERDGAQPTDLITCPLNANYTFETFVVGESNQFAHAAAQAVADPESRAYNPLFIYGGTGLGKTHLMQAIGQKLQTYGQHFNVLYVSSEAFMNAFIEAVAQKKMVEFRNCFRNVDLLLVDDVQFFSGAEQTQTEFFHTFNVLYDAGKKIVISSDHPPKELHELEERLRSRFEWGLIVDIQPPDLETRVAILRRKARMMNIELPPEVTIYIAERIRSNLRKLEGSLKRLSAHSTLTRQPITMEMARTMLGPFLVGEEPRKISIEKVQMAVCNYFNITLHEMTGPNRARKFAMPRQIAAYLCRELTDQSFPEIARKFGGRDHSSIIHSHRKIQKDMAVQLSLQNLIKYLTKTIKEEPAGH